MVMVKEPCRCKELQEKANDVDIICESCKTHGSLNLLTKSLDLDNSCNCMDSKYDEVNSKLSHDLAKLCSCLEHRAWCCFYTYDKEQHKKHWIKYYKLMGE